MKPFRKPDLCPESANHRMGPINHVDWVEWSEQLAQTHEQAQCPGCDLWVVWIPLNDEDLAPERPMMTGIWPSRAGEGTHALDSANPQVQEGDK